MIDSERTKPRGINYYEGTIIRGATTVRIATRPLRQIQGGSEDFPVFPNESGEQVTETILPNPLKERAARLHTIYSSPQPVPWDRVRYIKAGGWQKVKTEDKGKEFPW